MHDRWQQNMISGAHLSKIDDSVALLPVNEQQRARRIGMIECGECRESSFLLALAPKTLRPLSPAHNRRMQR